MGKTAPRELDYKRVKILEPKVEIDPKGMRSMLARMGLFLGFLLICITMVLFALGTSAQTSNPGYRDSNTYREQPYRDPTKRTVPPPPALNIPPPPQPATETVTYNQPQVPASLSQTSSNVPSYADVKAGPPTPGVKTVFDAVFGNALPSIQVLGLSILLAGTLFRLADTFIFKTAEVRKTALDMYETALLEAALMDEEALRARGERVAYLQQIAVASSQAAELYPARRAVIDEINRALTAEGVLTVDANGKHFDLAFLDGLEALKETNLQMRKSSTYLLDKLLGRKD